MNIVKNITVNLSEDEVKAIIANYIRNELCYETVTAKDVSFDVGRRCVGFGPIEHDECYFAGAKVKCKLEE